MRFSPDEIAGRAFTPSAEGYHPGEVRDFLERLAWQVRKLEAGEDPGPLHTGATGAMVDERLSSLEDRLDTISTQLSVLLAAMSPMTSTADHAGPQPTPAAVEPPRVEPAAAHVVSIDDEERISADERVAASVGARGSLPRVVAQPESPADGATAATGASATAATAAAAQNAAPSDSLKISTTAHDLLDGVLDDVMGRLNSDLEGR